MFGENYHALGLLENAFASQKFESRNFYSCPLAIISPRLLSSPHKQRDSENLSPQAEREVGRGNYE